VLPLKSLPVLVLLKIFLATFLWGTAFPVNKELLSILDPMAMDRLRFFISGLFLLSLSAALRVGSSSSAYPEVSWYGSWDFRQLGYLLAVAFVGNAMFYGFFYQGVERTSASSAAVVDGTGPVMSAVLAHFVLRGDRLTWRKATALALAFTGILTVAFGHNDAVSQVSAFGCFLILIAMLCGATGTILIVRYRGPLDLSALVGLQHLLGGVFLLLSSLTLEDRIQFLRLAEPTVLWPLLYLSFVSATAFRLWFGVVRVYKITSVAVFSFLTSLWGTSLSVGFLGEPLTASLVLGQILVISAILMLYSRGDGDYRRFGEPKPQEN
jgi:drug/metabolite transporter (DMT)-like permease